MATKTATKKTPAKKTSAKKKSTTKETSAAKVEPVEMLAQQLAYVLSDTYVLAVKVHGYHWNVMGPSFAGLHAFFEAQYNALITAADDLAERIRALGMMPDGSMDAFLQNTIIKEAGTSAISAEAMLDDLQESYELLAGRLLEAEGIADEMDDIVTQSIVTDQLVALEKTMWMIRSHFG
ncbi:MAG: Dps family protein [Bdellovibrionales bacterium]